MKHLLVTNDFPPKIGGIQSYLWELWRRLDPADVTVLTTPYEGAADWDAQQPYRVVRTKQWWLLPTARLVKQINGLAREVKAELIVLDPVFPLGLLGPKLDLPYIAIAHGAEYVIPAKLPIAKDRIRKATHGSVGIIACGEYVAQSVAHIDPGRSTSVISIPPGVDVERFQPATADQRDAARRKFNIGSDEKIVLGVSRLVPRKGFDSLVKAAALLRRNEPKARVLIAGKGRVSKSLQASIDKLSAPVTLMGRVPDADLPDLYAAADVFCMPCHDRWFGLEQEGFGIVFVEAGAAGLASVAGLSGGSGEAILHGKTGLVIGKVEGHSVAAALAELLGNPQERSELAAVARQRAVDDFSYDHLALRLDEFLKACSSTAAK